MGVGQQPIRCRTGQRVRPRPQTWTARERRRRPRNYTSLAQRTVDADRRLLLAISLAKMPMGRDGMWGANIRNGKERMSGLTFWVCWCAFVKRPRLKLQQISEISRPCGKCKRRARRRGGKKGGDACCKKSPSNRASDSRNFARRRPEIRSLPHNKSLRARRTDETDRLRGEDERDLESERAVSG